MKNCFEHYSVLNVILSEAKNLGIDSQMLRLTAQHDKLLDIVF